MENTFMKDRIKKGLVLVFTGNGKGKTSTALGVLLRSVGHEMRAGLIQFIKSADRQSGEVDPLRRLGVDVLTLGDGFTWLKKDESISREKASAAWKQAQEWILSGQYDTIVMDEITYLFQYNWLDLDEVLAWLKENKPPLLNLVFTGRNAPDGLLDYADLVTNMSEVKHPFSTQGIPARAGIDF